MPKTLVYFQEVHPVPTETFVQAEIEELFRRSYSLAVLTHNLSQPGLENCLYRDVIYKVDTLGSVESAVLQLAQKAKSLDAAYLHSPFITDTSKFLVAVAEQLDIPFGFSCHAYDLWKRGARIEPERIKQIAVHPLCVTAATEGSKHREYLLSCGVPEHKIVITPNSVDRRKLPERKGSGRTSLSKLVVVGRPVPKKGVLVAIDAVRILRLRGFNLTLEIVGAGDLDTPYGQEVGRAAAQFDFISSSGMLNHVETINRIRDADALLMPSMVAEDGDSDGIPTVLTEAMLMGVPVVATDVGSISDLVIDGRSGLLARPGDPASLSAKIADLSELFDQGKINTLISNAERQAVRHETQSSVNQLVAHLESSLGSFDC
jgi:glycosyltransferase involved in cell wall biosynthesis